MPKVNRQNADYTVNIKIKFIDMMQLNTFSMSKSILAERCLADIEDDDYVEKLFEENECCEADVSYPAEIFFAEGSGGLQELQTDLTAAWQCGAEIEISMKWVGNDEPV